MTNDEYNGYATSIVLALKDIEFYCIGGGSKKRFTVYPYSFKYGVELSEYDILRPIFLVRREVSRIANDQIMVTLYDEDKNFIGMIFFPEVDLFYVD